MIQGETIDFIDFFQSCFELNEAINCDVLSSAHFDSKYFTNFIIVASLVVDWD